MNLKKQVNRKMEELRLDPSRTVWERVESRLHKKKRRRGIIWFPFLFASLLGGYFFMQHHSSPDLFTRPNNKKDQASSYPTRNKLSTAITKTKAVANAPASTKAQKNTREQLREKLQEGLPYVSGSLHQKSIAITRKNNGENTAPAGYRSSLNEESGSAYKKGKSRLVKNSYDEAITEKPGLQNEPVVRVDDGKKLLSDTAAFQGGDKYVKEPVAGTVSPALIETSPGRFAINPAGRYIAGQTVKLAKNNKLVWGIVLQPMKTSVSDGKLHSFFAGSQDAQAASYLINNPSGNIALAKPAAVKKGVGFSGGFFLRKQLTGRVAVSSGLYYTLFTTETTTGNRVDSTIALAGLNYADQFFRAGNNKYISRYHFVELPLAFEWQLNKGRVPFFGEAGVSVSRLVASNALHYSSILNGYYKNNAEINHTQLSVLTGVYVQAFPGSRHVIRIGPQLRYGLTRLFTQVNQRNHMLQYGLSIGTVIR